MNNATGIASEADDRNSRGPTVRGMCPRPIVAIPVCVIVVLLGLLWWIDPAETHLPLCSFHAMTGLDCPGCGATRATHELLHGRLRAAWHYNALWVMSLPLVAYVMVSELRTLSGRRPLPGDLPRRVWFWMSLAAAAIVFSVVRNLV
jgi:hypothetical protein